MESIEVNEVLAYTSIAANFQILECPPPAQYTNRSPHFSLDKMVCTKDEKVCRSPASWGMKGSSFLVIGLYTGW
jgi:hypothetical protein